MCHSAQTHSPVTERELFSLSMSYSLFCLRNTLQINAWWVWNPPVNYGQENPLDKKSLRCAGKQSSPEAAQCALWSLTCHWWFTSGSHSWSWSSRKCIFHGMLSASEVFVSSHFNNSMASHSSKKILHSDLCLSNTWCKFTKAFQEWLGLIKNCGTWQSDPQVMA